MKSGNTVLKLQAALMSIGYKISKWLRGGSDAMQRESL